MAWLSKFFGEDSGAPSSDEASQRKARSIVKLKVEGVPTSEHLPVIEQASEVTPHSKEEIGKRAIATCICAVKGEGLEQEIIESLVKKFEAEAFFSPKESQFIRDADAGHVDRTQFCWRYECYWVFLWALGYIKRLERPEALCDVKTAVTILRELGTRRLIEEAQLRPISDVLDETDLIYRYHWAVVEARLHGKDAPAGLEPGVVMERHRALSWLVRYCDQEWDEVTMDT